jgi:Tol biopolymer transport system component
LPTCHTHAFEGGFAAMITGFKPEARSLLSTIALSLTIASGLTARPACAQAEKKASADRVLFVSDREKSNAFAIYTMNADGSDQTRISKGEGMFFDPSWSPDHKRILFSRIMNPEKRMSSLCTMSADGTDVVEFVPGKENTLHVGPSWSPDGKHIAYSAANIGDGKIDSSIYVMDSDGKNQKKIVEGVVPVWSPDSKRLLFSPTPESGVPALKTIDLDGTNVKTLAEQGFGAAWSPDGKRFVYTGVVEGNPALFSMDSDGSNLKQLTKFTDTITIGPVWSADGKSILFTKLPKEMGDKPQMEVWRMDADGSNGKAVTKTDSLIGSGTTILFVMRAARK